MQRMTFATASQVATDGGAASAPGGVSPHGDEYDIFIGMNQDGDHEAEAENDNQVPSLEHDVSHASEALEMIAGDGAEDVGLEDGEGVQKHFDDFLERD